MQVSTYQNSDAFFDDNDGDVWKDDTNDLDSLLDDEPEYGYSNNNNNNTTQNGYGSSTRTAIPAGNQSRRSYSSRVDTYRQRRSEHQHHQHQSPLRKLLPYFVVVVVLFIFSKSAHHDENQGNDDYYAYPSGNANINHVGQVHDNNEQSTSVPVTDMSVKGIDTPTSPPTIISIGTIIEDVDNDNNSGSEGNSFTPQPTISEGSQAQDYDIELSNTTTTENVGSKDEIMPTAAPTIKTTIPLSYDMTVSLSTDDDGKDDDNDGSILKDSNDTDSLIDNNYDDDYEINDSVRTKENNITSSTESSIAWNTTDASSDAHEDTLEGEIGNTSIAPSKYYEATNDTLTTQHSTDDDDSIDDVKDDDTTIDADTGIDNLIVESPVSSAISNSSDMITSADDDIDNANEPGESSNDDDNDVAGDDDDLSMTDTLNNGTIIDKEYLTNVTNATNSYDDDAMTTSPESTINDQYIENRTHAIDDGDDDGAIENADDSDDDDDNEQDSKGDFNSYSGKIEEENSEDELTYGDDDNNQDDY